MVACGGSSPKSISLNDNDLDNAPVIEEVSQLAISNVVKRVHSQGNLPINHGFVVYIQRDTTLGENGTRIVRIDMDTKEQGIIYEGNRGVESVAISADGTFIVFTALLDQQYEVFAYDLSGKILEKAGDVLRLTETVANEEHVSMALDRVSGLMPIAWQVVSQDKTTAIVANLRSNKMSKHVLDFSFEGKKVSVEQPSINGGGDLLLAVANVDTSESSHPALVLWDLRTLTSEIIYDDPLIKEIITPSLNYKGDIFLFTELYDEELRLSYRVIDLGFAKLKKDILVSHPYLTAGGRDYVYAIDGTVYAARALEDTPEILVSNLDGLVDSSPYWAKAPTLEKDELLIYSGNLSQTSPFFARPDVEGYGLRHDERTVPHHVFEFEVPKAAVYAIESSQDYDGYLSVYKEDFNTEHPQRGLLVANDNFDIGFSPGPPPVGKSKVFVQLEEGIRYFVVTSSCGHNESVCGTSLGNFTNTVTITDEPLIPDYVLPEPDHLGFDIQIRFSRDVLTSQLSFPQTQALKVAASRWEDIINEDLEDIQNFDFPTLTDFEVSPNVLGILDDLLIDVRVTSDLNGALARAAPLLIRQDGPSKHLPAYGYIELSAREFTSGAFADDQLYQRVLEHEIGHVLGIGTLWKTTNNVDGNFQTNPPKGILGLPNPNYNPGFIGLTALKEYNLLRKQIDLGPINAVPIANTGKFGNYNAHWREFDFLSELMTPLSSASAMLSPVTAASLEDLGYRVNMASTAINANYQLTPRFPAQFEEISPQSQLFREFEDYYAFTGLAANAEGIIEAIDVVIEPPYDNTSGCSAQDFESFQESKIALIQLGGCSVENKLIKAREAGAAAVILFNQGTQNNQDLFIGVSLESFPVIAISYTSGENIVKRIEEGKEIKVLIKVNGESSELQLAKQNSKPRYILREEVLQPIGTISSDGSIRYFPTE